MSGFLLFVSKSFKDSVSTNILFKYDVCVCVTGYLSRECEASHPGSHQHSQIGEGGLACYEPPLK
jgi:hypothetical protein